MSEPTIKQSDPNTPRQWSKTELEWLIRDVSRDVVAASLERIVEGVESLERVSGEAGDATDGESRPPTPGPQETEPVDLTGIEHRDIVVIPAGVTTSLKVWFDKHQDCGGEHVTYVGEYELRIGCTCGDKQGG